MEAKNCMTCKFKRIKNRARRNDEQPCSDCDNRFSEYKKGEDKKGEDK